MKATAKSIPKENPKNEASKAIISYVKE